MKAVRVESFGGPEVLKVQTVDDPPPGAGQVLVRMHAVGINPVEAYIRSGQYAKLPTLPFTPGSDGAGIVEAVGVNAGHFQAGDRVYLSGSMTGTYAELALADVSDVHPLPDNVSFSQGAALGVPYATAWRGLFLRARARAGETVLIHGATGGVGLAAIQLAAAAGLNVIATGGSPAGRQMATAQGATQVLDHHAESHWQAIVDATDGRGVDVIVELLANVNLGRDLQLLARGGRVAVIGSRGPVEINPRDAMAREATILGVMVSGSSSAELVEIHAAIRAGLATGALAPVVAAELPLQQAPQAHERVMQAGAGGKVVLVP
ncbi:MAG: NADPH:quinone reductase [Sinobacteraceae bacterium]|nr:NADPH:quinone reductase [Nevskiaceae bacterium]